MAKAWMNSVPVGSQKTLIEGAGPYRDPSGGVDLGGTTICRRWANSSTGTWGLTLFAAFWNGFVALFLAMSLHGPVTVNGKLYTSLEEAWKHDATMPVFLLFPLVGIFFLYLALAVWVNRTAVSVESGLLRITRGPLIWINGLVSIDGTKIQQLYVQVRETDNDGKRSTSYRVMAQVLNESDRCIESGLTNYSDARILEQWIEKKLGIVDRSVPGEA